MKKLLVGTAAIALGLVVAAPAQAQLQLGVAGHFKGYVTYTNQDSTDGAAGGPGVGFVQERHLDILRDTEIHFTGETTLDNGLTVGVHVEATADAGDGFGVDESYAYASGYWGRVNFGDEDGAAYLLQVAAPSADSNVDGIRQYVNPVNYGLTVFGANAVGFQGPQIHGPGGNAGSLDYANDLTRHFDKITYLTPVFSGFQAGVSFTPDASGSALASRTFGTSGKDDGGLYGSVYEGAARWEGTFNNVGLNLGGGYTHAQGDSTNGDVNQWNVGGDVNVAAFGLGAVYTKTNTEDTTVGDQRTWDAGADWTSGPFKLGASWLNNKTDGLVAGNDVKTNRYSGGVVYTFAPGMSFRGSVGFVKSDVKNTAIDVNATYGLLGTQINF